MLPNGGYFARFICPDARSGECFRPYCHYGGHTSGANVIISEIPSIPSSVPVVSNGIEQLPSDSNGVDPIADPNVPSYSTVPTEHFQGYQGYFASSSSPPPTVPKRGLLPTPPVVAPVRPTRPAQHVRPQVQQRPQRQRSPTRKPASPQKQQKQQPESNLNSLARDLAAINNEIERLQRKLTGADNGGGDDESTADNDTPVDIPGYDPEEPTAKRSRYGAGIDSAGSTNATDSSSDEQYRPQPASKASSGSAYKPTPIGELEKPDQPRNKMLKDSWIVESHVKPKKKVASKALPKQKTATIKPVALLEKESKKPSKSTGAVSDLFGDDSDSDAPSTTAGRRATFSAKAATTSKSKDDPEDMASLIEDLIAPTAGAPPQRPKKESSGDSSGANAKKRIAAMSNSSVEAVKKLREAGGERSKGHLLTARQQLESRMAQVVKLQEEAKAKQADGNGEPRKRQAASQQLSSDIGTQPKGEKRVARVPKPVDATKGAAAGRPILAIEVGAKVPTSVRQQYLNLIIDDFLKVLPEQEAYQQAVEEERTVYAKAASRQGYLNSIVNTIKRIRELSASASSSAEAQAKKMAPSVSHSAVVGGKPATKHSYTVGRSGATKAASGLPDRRSGSNLPTDEFYEALQPFILSMEQQASNGYPRPDPENPNCAIYLKDEVKKMYVDDAELRRICIRCGKTFLLTAEGEYVLRDDCIFHWGRAWKKKIAGSWESRYTCCQEDLSSEGCSVSRYHVSDCMPRRALNGYVYTNDWSAGYQQSEAKVFALDCEMVYTTCGNELARVTVVSDQGQVVYERCVRPQHTILDYNTRFSGLTEDLLLKNDSAVSLEEVQHDLASLFTSQAILIGHSLESDFRALKLIHDKVVDTSVVFPHRLGAPYKRALKTLAVEFLKKIIQDDVDGHDSKEDAITCMDLMKWRVKQEKR